MFRRIFALALTVCFVALPSHSASADKALVERAIALVHAIRGNPDPSAPFSVRYEHGDAAVLFQVRPAPNEVIVRVAFTIVTTVTVTRLKKQDVKRVRVVRHVFIQDTGATGHVAQSLIMTRKRDREVLKLAKMARLDVQNEYDSFLKHFVNYLSKQFADT